VVSSPGVRGLQATALVRAVGGKGVVLSGGAGRVTELRGAHDVANLGTLMALEAGAAKVRSHPSRARVWKAATSEAEPRRKQGWFL
jgi:RNase P/RNase MRP subunit p30